ncbi:MAG TPA: AraC family transcriptional regulator [Daejeonella sp.]|uniref:helix-turn-helix domain-containing protein n=1 Tax=Daejeonella sp. TaxID=2805397 RepID=UPI002EDB247E
MLHVTYSLYAISAGSLCLLSVLLLFNITRVNTVANRWLAAFYLFLAFALFQQFIYKLGLAMESQLFIHILELTRWALAPCFYLSIVYFVDPGKKSLKLLAHFIPALGFLIFSLLFIMPGIHDPATPSELPHYLGFIFRYFSIVQIIIYWILSFRLIASHTRNIRLIASTIESIDLFWIKQLLFGTLLLTVIRIVSYNGGLISLINPVLYCLGIFFIAFFSLRQGIIYPVTAAELPEITSMLKRNNNRERLSTDQVNELKSKVVLILEERKLFLDPSLTLADLSREVGIGIHELSYIINNGLNKNFYNLINEMRVEEAKKILLSEKIKYSDMIGIAIEAGFNSKTTFNTTFKKLTGQTPTDFVRSNSNSAL